LARTGYELNPNIEPDAAAAVAAKSWFRRPRRTPHREWRWSAGRQL